MLFTKFASSIFYCFKERKKIQRRWEGSLSPKQRQCAALQLFLKAGCFISDLVPIISALLQASGKLLFFFYFLHF